MMTVSSFHQFGGHGSTITNLCLGLDKLGYETAIASYSFDKKLPEQIKKIKLNKLRGLTTKEFDYDLIHNHHPLMNYHSLFTAKPFIFHLHGASNKIQEMNLKISLALCQQKIKGVISISNTVSSQIHGIASQIPRMTITLGVDSSYFHPNIETDYKIGEPQLFFVGVLFPHKNIENLVNFMPKILNEFPNAHLQIAGIGPSFENIKSKIQKLGLNKNVQLLGRISNEELRERFAACDIYVSPSMHEMLDLPAIEVMGCAKPVLLSNISAHIELIQKTKAGKIFQINSSKDFIKKLKEADHA